MSHTKVNRSKVYLLIILSAAVIAAFLFVFNYFFSIRKIELQTENKLQTVRGLESLKGKNIFLISVKKETDVILAQNPQLLDVSVAKKYPDTLILTVKSSRPIAYFKLNAGFVLLDETGKILAKTKKVEQKLPLIKFYQLFDFYQLSAGDFLNYKEIETALYLLKECNDLDLKVESIDINGLSMIVFNVNSKILLFSGEKDKEIQRFDLETIIRRFKIEAKDFKKLDFRFDKPVVIFE